MEQLIEALAAYFKIDSASLELEPIRHGTRRRQNVCRLRIGPESYLLKQHDIVRSVVPAGYTPLEIEVAVLTLLQSDSCQVPRVIWQSERFDVLLLEWCGEHTLDALAQRNNTSVAVMVPLLHTVLRELCKIEACFTTHAAQFEPYVFPFNAHVFLQDVLERGKKVVDYLAHMRDSPLASLDTETLNEAWNVLVTCLQSAPTTLGSLDNNARNIVIWDRDSPFFIDVASIGWNWQEMRLVQLFNSIGAFLGSPAAPPDFVCLLNRDLVTSYAEWVSKHRENCSPEEIAARVDSHQLLFYLSVIDNLLRAVAQPEVPENRRRLEAWGDAQARFRSALTHLLTARLSDDVYTNRIRELIADRCPLSP